MKSFTQKFLIFGNQVTVLAVYGLISGHY